MAHARKHRDEPEQPDHTHDRINLKRNSGNHIRRQLKHQCMRQKVQKDCQSAAPEEFDGPFRQMALAALLGSFLSGFELSLEPPGIDWPGVLALRTSSLFIRSSARDTSSVTFSTLRFLTISLIFAGTPSLRAMASLSETALPITLRLAPQDRQ